MKPMKTTVIIEEANSLPINERAFIIDSLLKSFNPTESDIDREWTKLARKRLSELRSGAVQSIPGEKVFGKISKRFSK